MKLLMMKLATVLLCGVIVSSVSDAAMLDPSSSSSSSGSSSSFSLTQSQAKTYLLDIFKNDMGFAKFVKEVGSKPMHVDSGEVKIWFDQQVKAMKEPGSKGKIREISLHLKSLPKIGLEPGYKCSDDGMFAAFDFINRVKTIDKTPNAVHYAKSIAANTLKRCAKEYDKIFRESRKEPFEVAMDQLFESLSKLESEEMLLKWAGDFQFDRMPQQETICKVAIASNTLRKTGGGSRKFDLYMSKVRPVSCENHVEGFFQETCNSGRNVPEGGIRILNAAIALGVESNDIASDRYLKLNEYKRICRDYPKFKETIAEEMKKVSQNTGEPFDLEKLVSKTNDAFNFDSPGDAAYFEALRSSATEGAQRHYMLLDEDGKSLGGLKFWRKWTH